MSFTYETAQQIVAEAHKGRLSRSGGAYVDTLNQISAHLRDQGHDVETQICAQLHDLYELCPDWTEARLAEMGCPESILITLRQLDHLKDQAYIDERSCALIAQGVPAEDATYQAREEEYLRYVTALAQDPKAKAVKTADLSLFLADERLLKAERRELKNQFREAKFRKALALLKA